MKRAIVRNKMRMIAAGALAVGLVAPSASFAWGVNATAKVNSQEAGNDAYRSSFNRYDSDNVSGGKTIRTKSDDVGRDKINYSNSFNKVGSAEIKGNAKNVITGGVNQTVGHDFRSTNNAQQTLNGGTSGASAFGGAARSSSGNDSGRSFSFNRGGAAQGGKVTGANQSGATYSGTNVQSAGSNSDNSINFSPTFGDVSVHQK